MKSLISILALFAAPILAQTMDPELVGSAGASHNTSTLNVEWSIGEPVIGGAGNITFGYQQLDDSPTPIVAPEAGLSGMRLKRSPGMVKIVFAETKVGYEVNLFNSQGKTLKNYSVNKGQKELNIPTKNLGVGTLFMNVHTTDKKLVQGFKLVGD